jgi:hypothetical protein
MNYDPNDELQALAAGHVPEWIDPSSSIRVPEIQPTTPQPFQFALVDASDVWTCDPAQIAGLSDAAIVEGLLRDKEVASIVGAAKTAKTWWGMSLAISIAAGAEFLGFETHARKVLYLDYELKHGTFTKRLSMIASEQPANFYFQCLRGEMRLPSVLDVERLILENGFGVIVIDSLYRTGWLSEENNNDAVSRELAILQNLTRNTGCTIIVIDHTAKGGGAERSAVDAARGASSKGGFYDAIFVLRGTDKGPDPSGTYAILDPVLRDWPGFKKLPLISFSWSSTACEITKIDEIDKGETTTDPAQVIEFLTDAEAPVNRKDIAAALDISEPTVRRVLDKLVRSKRVVEAIDPRHKQRLVYRLPDIGDAQRQTPPNRDA